MVWLNARSGQYPDAAVSIYSVPAVLCTCEARCARLLVLNTWKCLIPWNEEQTDKQEAVSSVTTGTVPADWAFHKLFA